MSSTAVSKTITELKVSAHLMTLDAGLFCVFNSPGALPPDVKTGLPGVRLSAAPAPAGFGGKVSISGFNAGGWLGGEDGAVLVRVSGGAGQVLVTVYQDPDGQHDAPKLQVIRLTEDAAEVPTEASAQSLAAPAPGNAPADASPGRKIEVAAHIYGLGDVGGLLGEWMGERGSKRWIEGFGLMPGEEVAPADIEYQAVLGRGWLSPWSEGGQFCGSRGMSLPILGLRVRLHGAAASTHAVSVSATFVDGTEIGPVSDGEPCEAPSLSPLETFQVTLRPLATAQIPTPATGTATARAPARPKESMVPRTRGRGRTAAPAASVKAVRKQAAPASASPVPVAPVPVAPVAAAAAKKPGRKAAPAAASEPPTPVVPPKAAKRTPSTTRRR